MHVISFLLLILIPSPRPCHFLSLKIPTKHCISNALLCFQRKLLEPQLFYGGLLLQPFFMKLLKQPHSSLNLLTPEFLSRYLNLILMFFYGLTEIRLKSHNQTTSEWGGMRCLDLHFAVCCYDSNRLI